jgi:hypothetical protein
MSVMDVGLYITGSVKDFRRLTNGMMTTDMVVLGHNKIFSKKVLTLHNKMIIL